MTAYKATFRESHLVRLSNERIKLNQNSGLLMTAQFSDEISYQEQVMALACCPLSQYSLKSGVKLTFLSLCSANWRGYVCAWEILDDRLYLKEIRGNLSRDLISKPAQWLLDPLTEQVAYLPPRLSLEVLFPGYPNGIFAHWFTGKLRCPKGSLIQYKHMGFESIYESDLLLTIQKGILVSSESKLNEAVNHEPN